MCRVSHVVSRVIFFSLKKIGQSGGASQYRVCYQRGLPRLVFLAECVVSGGFDVSCGSGGLGQMMKQTIAFIIC